MVKVYQKYSPLQDKDKGILGVLASPTGPCRWCCTSSPDQQDNALVPALETLKQYSMKTGLLRQSLFQSTAAPGENSLGLYSQLPPVVTALISAESPFSSTKPTQQKSPSNNASNLFFTGLSNGAIQLWDLESESCLLTLQGHSKAVTSLAYDPFTGLLASGSQDTHIIIWDTFSESGKYRLKGHKDEITGLAFVSSATENSTDDSLYLISSSKDALVKCWDLTTQYCLETIVSHTGSIWSLEWFPHDRLLFTGGEDGRIRVYELNLSILSKKLDISQNAIISEEDVASGSTRSQKALSLKGELEERSSKSRVQTLRLLSHSQGSVYLGVQGPDSLIELYKIRSSKELEKKFARKLKRAKEKKKNGVDVEMNEEMELDDKIQLTLHDKIPKCAQLKASAKLRSFDIKSGLSSKFSKDSVDTLRILCHLSNNALEVHEILLSKSENSHRLVNRLERDGHRSDIRALALSSDDELFASGASESLKVWNVTSGQCLHSFASGYILTCAFLPGNRYVLAGTKEGDLELYDLTSGTLLETFEKAHEGPIWSLHMRPDKTGLVTGSQDKDVKFWDFRLIEDDLGQVCFSK